MCKILIEKFKAIDEKESNDRDQDFGTKLENFTQIYLDAEEMIKNNEYDIINFYGILFCYLGSYDKKNFHSIIKSFSNGNADILYEIFIIYYSHFKDSLNKDLLFYNNFIKYALKVKKEFKILERILYYIILMILKHIFM